MTEKPPYVPGSVKAVENKGRREDAEHPEGGTGDVASIFQRVKKAQRDRDFRSMISHLDLWLQVEPNSLFAQATRAHVLARLGAFDELVERLDRFLERAEASNPDLRTLDRLMRIIQFASAGWKRYGRLRRLLAIVDAAAGTPEKPALDRLFLSADLNLALRDYEAFCAVSKEIEVAPSRGARTRGYTRIAKMCASGEFVDYSRPKVFGIGLSRTGTQSLSVALGRLGRYAIHWLNPYTRFPAVDDDFLLFDGFTDIVVSHQFERLYYMFPNAKFIYTTRPVGSWERSISRHYGNYRSLSDPRDLGSQSVLRRFDNAIGGVEMTLYGKFPSWRDAYESHERRVSEFFRGAPPGKFLELSICGGEGWERLAPFLEKPVPDSPFPRLNAEGATQ